MTTALDRYRASMRESEMERTVSDLVTLRGGRLFHVRRSDVAPELTDLPDWLIVAPWMQTVLLIEAKSQKRKITAGQQGVLDQLSACDQLVTGIVRPVPHPGEWGYQEFLEWMGGAK